MHLSLNDIHRTLSAFFDAKYRSPASQGPVLFRFDRFGSILTDADLTDPRSPLAGPSPAVAHEVFSDLVNRVPREAGDGASVVMTQDAIDATYYYALLAPAQRVVSPGAEASARESLVASFAEMKADALRLWEQQTFESSSGVLRGFKPSNATPADWYDATANAAWEKATLGLTATSEASPTGKDETPSLTEREGLWRMPPSRAVVSAFIAAQNGATARPSETGAPPSLEPVRRHLDIHQSKAPVVARTAAKMSSVRSRLLGRTLRALPANIGVDRRMERRVPSGEGATRIDRAEPVDSAVLRSLTIRDRLALNEAVQAGVQTAPLKARKLEVNFEYCLVQIDRPWLLAAFLNDDHWSVPGVPRGSVTDAADPAGMPYLPVGLVLVRALEIRADWSDEDRINAAHADRLGPFKVDAVGPEGSVVRRSVQAIGWMLQPLPALPPLGDPRSASPEGGVAATFPSAGRASSLSPSAEPSKGQSGTTAARPNPS